MNTYVWKILVSCTNVLENMMTKKQYSSIIEAAILSTTDVLTGISPIAVVTMVTMKKKSFVTLPMN